VTVEQVDISKAAENLRRDNRVAASLIPLWFFTRVVVPETAAQAARVLTDTLRTSIKEESISSSNSLPCLLRIRYRTGSLRYIFTNYGIGLGLCWHYAPFSGFLLPYEYGCRLSLTVEASLVSLETQQIVWGPREYGFETDRRTRPVWFAKIVERSLTNETSSKIKETAQRILADIEKDLPPETNLV
jgi:hypothetical protein